jgi:hypothetical protein
MVGIAMLMTKPSVVELSRTIGRSVEPVLAIVSLVEVVGVGNELVWKELAPIMDDALPVQAIFEALNHDEVFMSKDIFEILKVFFHLYLLPNESTSLV